MNKDVIATRLYEMSRYLVETDDDVEDILTVIFMMINSLRTELDDDNQT